MNNSITPSVSFLTVFRQRAYVTCRGPICSRLESSARCPDIVSKRGRQAVSAPPCPDLLLVLLASPSSLPPSTSLAASPSLCRLEFQPLARPSVGRAETSVLYTSLELMQLVQSTVNLMRMSHSSGCPCHGCSSLRTTAASSVRAGVNMISSHNAQPGSTTRGYATPVDAQLQKEYAFEVSIVDAFV